MTRIYNKKSQQEKRRRLRKNMTKAEAILWLQLKNKKILGQRFLRQYSVLTYIVDNYCPNAKLAIEVDGATHLSEEEIEYDNRRQKEIENFGIAFLRFRNDEIYDDLYNVIEKIKVKVGERINSTPPPAGTPL